MHRINIILFKVDEQDFQVTGRGYIKVDFFSDFYWLLSLDLMNISDKDGPLSTNIIIVLIADEIIKADHTAWRK